jgi:hypothetical protein
VPGWRSANASPPRRYEPPPGTAGGKRVANDGGGCDRWMAAHWPSLAGPPPAAGRCRSKRTDTNAAANELRSVVAGAEHAATVPGACCGRFSPAFRHVSGGALGARRSPCAPRHAAELVDQRYSVADKHFMNRHQPRERGERCGRPGGCARRPRLRRHTEASRCPLRHRGAFEYVPRRGCAPGAQRAAAIVTGVRRRTGYARSLEARTTSSGSCLAVPFRHDSRPHRPPRRRPCHDGLRQQQDIFFERVCRRSSATGRVRHPL